MSEDDISICLSRWVEGVIIDTLMYVSKFQYKQTKFWIPVC